MQNKNESIYAALINSKAVRYAAAALAGAAVTALVSRTADNAAVSGDEIKAKVSKYARVISSTSVGAGGLTAWTLEKDGKQVVLYSTSDGGALISGVVWNLDTAKNLTESLGVAQGALSMQAQPPAPTTSNPVAGDRYIYPNEPVAAAMDGDFKGEVSESMKTVDSLKGFKEGAGDINNTVYIIFDPRCHYCRDAYNATRQLVSRGKTIKWIPTAALGEPEQASPIIATILQSKDKDVLNRILSKHESINTKPTPETIKAMNDNLSFMFAAFKQNTGQQAGVPVAFFVDHRTGKPRMLTGVSDASVLQDIFGPL